MLNEVTPQVLVDAIDELLLLQRGKELGFALSDEQFAQIVSNIRKENKLENEEQFHAALKQEGLTLPELRRSIERQMIVNRVQQQDVMDKISVTEAESAAYFDAHKDEFTTPAAVTLREILVAVPDRAPRDRERRPGRRQRRPRRGGQDQGRGPPPAHHRGRGLRRARRGELRRAVEGQRRPDRAGQPGRDVAAAAGGGEEPEGRRHHAADPHASAATRSSSSRPAARRSCRSSKQVRNQVADKVFREKGRPELAKYLKKLREQAIIEWKNDDLKKAYEVFLARPAVPPASSN